MKKENELINDIKEQFSSLMNARSLAVSNDKRILEFLLENSNFKAEYKERFFEEQCGALIFKKDDFLNFLDLKLLSASYTSFSNKIGLGTSEKRFLKNNENVVLNFPFKDGVIKGGQSRDDDKSTELFFNNILAKSEIDVLFAPKVLNNFELLGKGDINEVLENKPNLLIKGNNLIALHTLKEYFRHAPQEDKVKLIYIDPPYNTGSDSFNYNDKFNHSTYLTFMKNRLEIARELLRDDGVIFVQCDDNEQAYLKVLMDEIFGEENYEVSFYVSVRYEGKTLSEKNNYQKLIETILCYKKTSSYNPNKDKEDYSINNFCWDINLLKSPDNIVEFGNRKVEIFYKNSYEIKKTEPSKNALKETWASGTVLRNNASGKLFDTYISDKRIDKDGYEVLYKVYDVGEDGLGYRFFTGPKKAGATKGKFYSGIPLDRLKELENGSSIKEKSISNFLQYEDAFGNCRQEGGVQLNAGKKPEALIKRIIEISTNENDLVLDFFAGSGTTLAVAHKMKRRYIGIEQMEYIESITKERLKKVIEGEQSGISKAVSWSGGGNLIYCELASLNAKFIEKIENSSDENELDNIYEALRKLAFIDYRADIQSDFKDLEFGALSFEEKKRILKKCLDRNMDYIPYADIEDSEYKIDEQTRILNKIFYKKS